jgi:hypothetical protein
MSRWRSEVTEARAIPFGWLPSGTASSVGD